MNITINTVITLSDVVKAVNERTKGSFTRRAFFAGCIALSVLGFLLLNFLPATKNWFGFLFIFPLLALLLPLRHREVTAKRIFKQAEGSFKDLQIIIDDDVIQFVSPVATKTRNWNEVESALTTSNFLFLYMNDKSYMFLKKSDIVPDDLVQIQRKLEYLKKTDG